MRVLQLTHNYPSVENKTEGIFLHRINKLLVNNGDLDISVILLKPKFRIPSVGKEYMLDGIKVKVLNYFRPRGRIFNAFDGLFMLSAMNFITKGMAKYDLIHSHWQTDAGLMGTFLSKRHKLQHIVSVRGARIFSKRRNSIYGHFSKFVFTNAGLIHTHGKNIQVELTTKYQLPASKVRWVPNPIFNGDQLTSLLKNRKNKFRKSKNYTFLFIGLDGKPKGLRDAVKAFLGANTKGCKLIIVTDVSQYFYKYKVQPLISNSKNIVVYGKMSQTKIASLFSVADVFLFPSYREGTPNVVLEAMAAGCYIICYDIPGLEKLVIHNQNGRLVEKNNIPALVNEIDLFVSGEMKGAFKNYTNYNHKFIVENYNADKIKRDYIRLYKETFGKIS